MKRAASTRSSPADSADVAALKPAARSAISNGTRLLVGIDGRSRPARRLRDLFLHYMAETGGKREQECRSLASLILTRESLDAALARGEPVEPMDLVRVCGAISRALVRLGLVAENEPELVPHDAPAWALGPRAPAPEEAA